MITTLISFPMLLIISETFNPFKFDYSSPLKKNSQKHFISDMLVSLLIKLEVKIVMILSSGGT